MYATEAALKIWLTLGTRMDVKKHGISWVPPARISCPEQSDFPWGLFVQGPVLHNGGGPPKVLDSF